MSRKIKQYVVFGDFATEAAENGEWSRLREICDEDPGAIGYRMFDTEEERKAYLCGLEDAVGWMNTYPLSKEEVRKFGKRMRLSEVEDRFDW